MTSWCPCSRRTSPSPSPCPRRSRSTRPHVTERPKTPPTLLSPACSASLPSLAACVLRTWRRRRTAAGSKVVAPIQELVSGLRISAWRRDVDGALVVNGVPSECVDIVKERDIIVHVMAGVLMDAEFERSFSSEFDN